MRRILAALGLFLGIVAAYLLLWPVPVEPVAWQAPTDQGYVDPYAVNDQLRAAHGISISPFEGPEDAALGMDAAIYVTTASGHVVRIRNGSVAEFAFTGGRPLGIEALADGSFVVANASRGLQRVAADGSVSVLLDTLADGRPVYPNNLAVGPDGIIYFSESSAKFGASEYHGTFEASKLDILEHGGHGRLVAFDPATGHAETLLDGLNYANGVAMATTGEFVLVAETGHYRVVRYWLEGPDQGSTEILIENLPGFPDNLKSGRNGRFWLGLVTPRNPVVDALSGYPRLRKMLQRLPAFVRPDAIPSSHVIAFNGDGEILMNLHDPSARFPALTGVLETQDNLYLTTLFGSALPKIAKQDLF